MPITDVDVSALPPTRRVRKPSGFDARAWWRVARRVAATLARENFTLIAAGCAFYALLALAPSLGAVAALYGFFADPAVIATHLEALRDLAPQQAYAPIAEQAQQLSSAPRATLGWASVAALLLAVWSARAGVQALMDGVALAYRERDGRNFLVQQLVTYLMTFACIALAAVALGIVVLVPAVLAVLPTPVIADIVASLLRWPVALVAVLLGLTLLYRFAPNRRLAQMPWVTPGAIAAVALWLLGSLAFSAYVARFGAYSGAAGALGGVAALLMWFWLSALAALVGAVLNAELELETAADTTVGPDRPMGQRDAFVADHVASE